MSISIADITIPKKKYEIVKKAEEDVEEIPRLAALRRVNLPRRSATTTSLPFGIRRQRMSTAALQDGFDDFNPIVNDE